MRFLCSKVLLFFFTTSAITCESDLKALKNPSVTIAFAARNGATYLPWFLGCLENLNYPKERISIWVATDHNEDNTSELLQRWVEAVKSLYHNVNLTVGEDGRYEEESEHLGDWYDARYDNIVRLRQNALDFARDSWSDYILMIDIDQFISDRNLLQHLMSFDKTIIAPMMNSTTLYSNFWGAITEDGYYQRSEDYLEILARDKVGVFEVPMVHSLYLMDLRKKESDFINFHPKPPGYLAPADDIMHFSFNARLHDVKMYITNIRYYGYLIPPVSAGPHYLSVVTENALFIRLEHIYMGRKLQPSPHVKLPSPIFPKKLGFDEIYMINLERRPERRLMMEDLCAELGIQYKYFPAVDGKKLNETYLRDLGVKQLEGYLDPYHKRPMKLGEIGCFLSHYFIWKDMQEKGYDRILILEDDVKFRLQFVKYFFSMMEEADDHIDGWDLLYIGRKIMSLEETFVPNSYHLVYPRYTYWTLSYALTKRGMNKLLNQDPISKMLPVDEFLPIMFDEHYNEDWKSHFSPRNVVALSANPLFVEPLKYIGEEGYVSDTEDSTVIAQSKQDPSIIEEKEEDGFSTSDSVNRNPQHRQTHTNEHTEL